MLLKPLCVVIVSVMSPVDTGIFSLPAAWYSGVGDDLSFLF